MSFLKRIFGGKKQPETTKADQLPWIEASGNQWKTRILDVRAVTQKMMSTSSDPQMATNAVSYGGEDGISFWEQSPLQDKEIRANISFMTDGPLAPGVLFIPRVMEHKWAIFFDGRQLIFVRSWMRKVFAVARTKQINNELIIESIRGELIPDQSADFTIAVLRYLLISHALGEVVPAPLPAELATETQKAGLWAFSAYGKMAHYGIFDKNFVPATQKPLRSHSLLHIAVAKSQLEEIEQHVQNGIRLDYLAADGLAPLHWSIAPAGTASLEKLLALGADPNVVSTEGATPIMNAVQSNKIDHLIQLLKAGASVNARDHRGFTALHRAAERGMEDIVVILLKNGADRTIEAEGHTALSFAQNRGHEKIAALLS